MKQQVFNFFVFMIALVNGVNNGCITKETCDDCIKTPTCVWCSDPDFSGSARCENATVISTTWCENSNTVNPQKFTEVLVNKPLGKSPEGVVQLRPQRIKLRLRVGQPHEFSIQYRREQDYPVDLYYLMDLSKSMEDDKRTLYGLGDKLSDVMKNLTKEFRIGFGSFVDKVIMPYTSTVPEKLKTPCTLDDKSPCAPPYGFKNNMPLTTNTKEFKQRVMDAPVSGNLDSPEGTLDAIMQAIVCKDEIGWRTNATRLLVVSTDAGYHLAGDGKLAGLIEPNDEQCHLDRNGEYTHHNVFDYPSISQINRQAREKEITILFAVTKGYTRVYENLAKRIHGAGYGELSSDSTNIVDLIEKQYKAISSKVEMTHNASGSVKIDFYSQCPGSKTQEHTNKCEKIKNQQLIDFTVKVQVTKCAAKNWKETIMINPVGNSESLIIDLEVICECECSRTDHNEGNSDKCSNHGRLSCGVCQCEENRVGKNCECDTNDLAQNTKTDNCINKDTNVSCSGYGYCRCNQCVCNTRLDPTEVISGPQCQCHNYTCPTNNKVICSGPDHGTCVCNKCECLPGWTGLACECSTGIGKCKKTLDGAVCSNRGNCTCDGCVCEVGETGAKYSGNYCEKCPWCSESKCQELHECVECLLDKDDSCVDKTCKTKVEILAKKLKEKEMKEFQKCLVKDKQKCNFEFYFSEDEDEKKFKVWAEPDRSCDSNIWAVIFGVIGFTIFIGILGIIIWKVVTTIHDKREYEKFEKERQSAKWGQDDNPLYKPSTVTFNNPTFGKK